tara:strand:+ start:18958 stop:20235 length:1278 start_codon:yes stop_codon:yes gene_type:complete
MKVRLSTFLRLTALVASVAFLAKAQAAYDVKKRGITLDDRFETEEMLRPFGHDFLLDLTVGINKNVLDVVNDGKDVSKTQGSDSEKLDAGQAFLRKYRDTEQTIRVGLNLGVPLPSFTAFDVKLRPNFRVSANLMANIGVRAQDITAQNVLDYVGQDVPQELKDLIIQKFGTMNPNDDIVAKAVQGESAQTQSQAQPYLNKFFYPSDTSVPNLLTYAKVDAKAGFFVGYEYDEHFFGGFNLYGMGRADTELIVTADALAKGGDTIEFGEEMNTTIVAAADYQFGYKNGNLTGFGSIEELKLATLSDNKEKGGELNYDVKPLLRVHGEYRYDFMAFTLRPFVGVYNRFGYSQGAQPYGGADLGTYVWDDRIGVQLRTMVDEEHLTLAPRIKLWLMQLEYSLKQPIKSKIDDTTISTLHSLNFRLFF